MPERKFAVLTDSSSDLPVELAEKHGVDILNFKIIVDGIEYLERDDFTPDEYYQMLRECKEIPATAHITTPRFLAQFELYDDQKMQQVLFVSINGNGSNNFNAATMAAQEFKKIRPDSKMQIFIVDSHTYSICYGWFVAEAARKLTNGAEMADVIDWLNDIFSRIEVVLGAFSLRFMKKSGRISAAAAFAGELLGLKPVVTLIDGVSQVRKKVRGDKDVLPSLMEYAGAHMDESKTYGIAGTDREHMDELKDLCYKAWKTEPLVMAQLGAAVTTNSGPDSIGLFYLAEPRPRN